MPWQQVRGTQTERNLLRSRYESRILKVLDHIRANLDGDLSLDALAEVAAMSRFHWHRVFHAMTGETAAEAVRRFRMHRAATWLVQTDRAVSDTARATGCGSVRSFARAFGSEYGPSPSAFRARGAPAPLRSPGREESKAMYEIEVAQVPARRLAALEHRGPYPEIGTTFGKLAAIATARGLWPHSRGMAAVYYDDPRATPPDRLRSHAGIIVAEDTPLPDGLEEVRTHGGAAAILHFRGDYSGLQGAYDHLYGAWLAQSGRTLADAPSYELYLNDPTDTAPDDLLTDIVVPLA